jgi:hypothetical protein
MPFSSGNISRVSDRAKIFEALEGEQVLPTPAKPFMRTTIEFLREIEVFLREFQMTETRFGLDAANDHKLVSRLRKGTTVTLQTAEMVRAHMEKVRYEALKEQNRGQRTVSKKNAL